MPERLVVLGAGAIGAGLGGLLHASGLPVLLVARGEHGRRLARDGLDLRLPGDSLRLRVPNVPRLDPTLLRPGDVVAVCVMGQHTAEAVAGLPVDVPVVSLQNGSRPLDVLLDRGHPTTAGMVYVPAERRKPGTVVLAGVPTPGAVLLGGWGRTGEDPIAAWLAQHLVAAGFRAEVEAEVAPWIRAKLLANLAGVVVALCDEIPDDVVLAARAEAEAVWKAAGLAYRSLQELGDRVGPLRTAAVDGLPRVGGSTRHALARGADLETATLHHPIRKLGARLGVPTPVNDALVAIAEAGGRRPGAMSAADLRSAVGL